jgi:hypothetical protein
VETKNVFYADGGQIIFTAKAANELAGSQVNTEGVVRARTLGGLKGKIEVYAHGGTANVAGTLDASAHTSGDGGFIETSGEKVKIAESAVITTKAAKGQTGTWLIDPSDFTIDKSRAVGDITGISLSAKLEANNVQIESAKGQKEGVGDIYVNDAITWAADTILTLVAESEIFINAAIKATGDKAGLVMTYGGEDYHILTPASFNGANVVEPEEGVAGAGASTPQTDDTRGKYGSVTLSGTDSTLVINVAFIKTPYGGHQNVIATYVVFLRV